MIISFIKALYRMNDQPALGFSDYDYHELLELIERHSLGSQIYSLLKKGGRTKEVPHFFRERLSHVYESCFFQNLLIKHETEHLLRSFDAQGIPVIPLKGAKMAERFFGHFAARGTSDIDLLVHPEHLSEAVRIVGQAGFNHPADDNPIHYHTEWMKEAPGLPEPLVVELHWSFVQENSARYVMEAPWNHSIVLPGYDHVRGLSAAYTFYTLCLHGASHLMDSYKYVMDITHMLVEHHDDIRLDHVLALARADHTLRRVKAALSVTYSLFPELNALAPLPFKPNLRHWTAIDSESSKLRQLIYQLSMLDSWKYRMIHLLRLLFPSRVLAAYSMDELPASRSVPGMYLKLYRQRLRRMFGG